MSTPLIPIMIMLALVTGGIFLMVYSMRMRAAAVARRVETVQSFFRLPEPEAAHGKALLEDYQFKRSANGLAVAEQQQIARLLISLGIPPDRAVAVFTGVRLTLTACGAAAAVGALSMPSPGWLPLASILAAAVAYYLPMMIVKKGLRTHRSEVASALPDALELLAICVDAGISLEVGLKRIGDEMREAQPALASELRLTWAEITLLPSVEQALLNLSERVDHQNLRSVVGTLTQGMHFGTPLAQSLRVAAAEMREDQLFQLEERANRLPALMTIPVILLILPTIFLIVGGPAVLKIMDTLGHR